jgi:hypothetical protein
MTGYRCAAMALSLVFWTLTGCSAIMETSKLPDGFALKEVAKTDAGTAFAVSSRGSYAATKDGKLMLVEAVGTMKPLGPGSPALLCFSPDGSKLAAALPGKDKATTLLLFDAAGKLKAETAVPDPITSMSWRSEQELLATALEIRRHGSGSTLISTLYAWDGGSPAVATRMSDVTVRQEVAGLSDQELYDTLKLAVSPYGDEIAYSTVKDSPISTPNIRIVTRNLASGAEHEIGTTSMGSGGLLYTPDGGSLIVGDAHALTRRLALPGGRESNAWPSSGDYPAISRSGEYLFLDGRLFQDGREVAWFPTRSRAAFVPDGSGMALSYDRKLYLLTGLNDKPAPPLPKDLNRLLQLRKLRSMGLISEKEYRAQKQRVPVQQDRVASP